MASLEDRNIIAQSQQARPPGLPSTPASKQQAALADQAAPTGAAAAAAISPRAANTGGDESNVPLVGKKELASSHIPDPTTDSGVRQPIKDEAGEEKQQETPSLRDKLKAAVGLTPSHPTDEGDESAGKSGAAVTPVTGTHEVTPAKLDEIKQELVDDHHEPVFRYPSGSKERYPSTITGTNASGIGSGAAVPAAGGNTARKEDTRSHSGLGRGFTYDDVGMRGVGGKKSSRQQQSRMGNTSDDEYKVVDEMRGERIPVTDLP